MTREAAEWGETEKEVAFLRREHLYFGRAAGALDVPCIMHDTTVLNVRPNHLSAPLSTLSPPPLPLL